MHRQEGDEMRKVIAALVVVTVVALLPATASASVEPRTGDIQLDWNLCWEEPGSEVPDWVGTVTIGGDTYGMAFFYLDSGKPFSDDPAVHSTGMAGFFGEIWRIYDDPIPVEEGCPLPDPEDVAAWGYDTGVVSLANFKYRMNGSVEEAFGALESWAGRNIHMSGDIGPDFLTAPGELRVN
jgi:hypothetical protein